MRGALGPVSMRVFLQLERIKNISPWVFCQLESDADPGEQVEVFPLLSLGFELNTQILSIAFTTLGSPVPAASQRPAPPSSLRC